MYPALYALARQLAEERFQQHVIPNVDHAARTSVARGRTLRRARTSLGTILVIAGNRLLVADAARPSGPYLDQKAS